jgi:hypothetical protein
MAKYKSGSKRRVVVKNQAGNKKPSCSVETNYLQKISNFLSVVKTLIDIGSLIIPWFY